MRIFVFVLMMSMALSIYADEKGKKTEWMSLEEAAKANRRKQRPLIVVVAPKESSFLESVDGFLKTKKVKSTASRFLKVYIDSSEESDMLKKIGLSKGDEYLLIYDYQLVRRESFERLPDDDKEFIEALKKVLKSNEAKRKIMAKAGKYYKAAGKYFRKKDYAKCIPCVYELLKIKEVYDAQHEDDGDVLNDEMFKKAEEMLKEMETEFSRMLREAESLRRKQQFGKALVVLSKARAQFSRLEGAEEEITRLEENIQKEVERYRKDK